MPCLVNGNTELAFGFMNGNINMGCVMNDELLRMRLISNRLTEEAPQAFHRYLYPKIDWENRLVCIKGARGTGKSTILRQHIRECFGPDEHAFYVSFDHYWFKMHSPLEFVEEIKNEIKKMQSLY